MEIISLIMECIGWFMFTSIILGMLGILRVHIEITNHKEK